MKTYKHLWEQFISMENLELAAKKAMRSKKNKAETKFFLKHKQELLCKLQKMASTIDFCSTSCYNEKKKNKGEKL